jgi:radical SAM superfamily enzyme YgiQ (UPF0313 family)
MKRLLLINPALEAVGGGRSGRSRAGGETGRLGRRLPNVGGVATMEPLGLAYVAALTPPDWEIRLWDEVVEPQPPDLDPDLVGISTLTSTAPRAYQLADAFRRRSVPVVLGGPHPTLMPEEAAEYADVVFRGEAEGAWAALIADFEAGRLQLRYEGGGPPLEHAVLPRRDLYRKRYTVAMLSASRGCRYRCEFCSIWKLDSGELRLRPVEDVWSELATVSPGASWVTLFTDDNIAAERDWAVELFRGIAERGLRRRFAVQASLGIAEDAVLLRSLRRAGCFAVMTGLESVSEESLRRMRKGVNLRIGVDGYRERIKQIHAHGMMVAGTFMFGNDGDGPDIFRRTADFVEEAGVDLAHFGLLVPDPGTDLYARLEREGRLLYTAYPDDYGRHTLGQALFLPQQMSPAQLEAGYRRAAGEVSRWPAVLRRSWRTWRDTGNAFAAVVAMAWTRTGLRARLADGVER